LPVVGALPEEDDEPEMEISVAPAAPIEVRRNPKQLRYTEDEVVASGEIQVRRSLIIRSSQPAIEIPEEQTELSGPPPPPPRPMARKRSPLRHLWLVGALVAGAGAVVVPSLEKPTIVSVTHEPSTRELELTGTMLGSLVDNDQSQTLGRAEVVAQSPMIRAAIVTDAATLADMAADNDMTFPLAPGQVLEVQQVIDGARATLLHLPKDAAPLGEITAGSAKLVVRDGVLGTLAGAPVQSSQPNVSGVVATWRPLDVAAVVTRLKDQTSGASLDGIGARIELVPHGAPPTTTVKVASATAPTLTIAATLVPLTTTTETPPSRVPQFVLAGVAVLLFLLYLVFAVPARRGVT
jgi:hypothetical protein